MEQLAMFESHFEEVAKEKKIEAEKEATLRKIKRRDEMLAFYKKQFGWKPEKGEKARISSVISFSKTKQRKAYTYCMRVEILSISNYIAEVKTTKEWEDACQTKSFPNKEGLIWSVPVEDLTPIFK